MHRNTQEVKTAKYRENESPTKWPIQQTDIFSVLIETEFIPHFHSQHTHTCVLTTLMQSNQLSKLEHQNEELQFSPKIFTECLL